jgi:hypothetical protein
MEEAEVEFAASIIAAEQSLDGTPRPGLEQMRSDLKTDSFDAALR